MRAEKKITINFNGLWVLPARPAPQIARTFQSRGGACAGGQRIRKTSSGLRWKSKRKTPAAMGVLPGQSAHRKGCCQPPILARRIDHAMHRRARLNRVGVAKNFIYGPGQMLMRASPDCPLSNKASAVGGPHIYQPFLLDTCAGRYILTNSLPASATHKTRIPLKSILRGAGAPFLIFGGLGMGKRLFARPARS